MGGNVDAVVVMRAGYLAASISVLFIFAVPSLRSRFLDYGARNDSVRKTKDEGRANIVVEFLDFAASLRVPHRWFASFYAVSVLASLIWASQILSGLGIDTIARHVSTRANFMTFRQVMTLWFMMFAQGSRRLYECMAISKPSNAQMWIGHWLLGILFYLTTNVAIWIEGIPSIKKHTTALTDFVFGAPDIRTFLGFIVFLLASGFQHDCHAYLASLKEPRKTDVKGKKPDYRLPEHPAFNISVTPHYFAECLIYLSMAIVAAPPGDWLNWTLISALTFVVVNLGVTAYGTKIWYEQKFGPECVRGKAVMVPFIY